MNKTQKYKLLGNKNYSWKQFSEIISVHCHTVYTLDMVPILGECPNIRLWIWYGTLSNGMSQNILNA